MYKTVLALLKGSGAMKVVVKECVLRRLIAWIVNDVKFVGVIVSYVLHLVVGLRNESSCPNEYWQHFQRSWVIYACVAIIALARVVHVDPCSFGESDFSACCALLHHGSYHHVFTPQILVADVVVAADEVVALVEAEKSDSPKEHGST